MTEIVKSTSRLREPDSFTYEAFRQNVREPAQIASQAHHQVALMRRIEQSLEDEEAAMKRKLQETRPKRARQPEAVQDAILNIYGHRHQEILKERARAQNTLTQARNTASEQMQVIRNAVSQTRSRQAILSGAITPDAIVTLGGTQPTAYPEREGRHIKDRQPDSPPRQLLHDAHPYVQRGRNKPDKRILDLVRAQSGDAMMASSSTAIVHLLSDHLVGNSTTYRPDDFRDPQEVALAVQQTYNTLIEFRQFGLSPMTLEEYQRPRLEAIVSHVRFLLMNTIEQELLNPDRTEEQLKRLYDKLTRSIRQSAELMGTTGFMLMSDAMKQLNFIEKALLAGRLSAHTQQDLNMPFAELMDETSSARMLVNARYRITQEATSRRQILDLPTRSLLLEEIIDILGERDDVQDIDLGAIFDQLIELGPAYFTDIINGIFETVDITKGQEFIGLMRASLRFSNDYLTQLENDLLEVPGDQQ